MVIDLRKHFKSDDFSSQVDYEVNLSELEMGGRNPLVEPVLVSAEFKSFSGSVLLEMELKYKILLPCDRCTEETEISKASKLSHILVKELNEEEDESYVIVENEKLDLDELVYTDVILELPSKILCSPNCKGLCQQCGINFNNGDCNCNKNQVDSRLEILKTLIE